MQINRVPSYPGGHTRVANWFLRDVMQTLTFAEVQVYLTLVRLDRKHKDGWYAFASNDTLAEWTGLNLRTVRRALDRLIDDRLIVVVGLPRQRQAVRYVIPTDPPQSDTRVRVAEVSSRTPMSDSEGIESDTHVRLTTGESDTQTPLLRPRAARVPEMETTDDDPDVVTIDLTNWYEGEEEALADDEHRERVLDRFAGRRVAPCTGPRIEAVA